MTFAEGSIINHNFLEVENINFVASNVVLDFELFQQWEFALANTVNEGNCQFRGLCWWGKRNPNWGSRALPPLLWVVYNRGGGTIYLRSHFYNSERDPVLWDLDWDWLLVGEDSE